MNIDAVKNFKVLLVGDAIIDEYRYVTPLGKSIKEPVISVRLERIERFRGGVWAAASHLIDLCKIVETQSGPDEMLNTRFVDQTHMRKLFTVHEQRPNNRIEQTRLEIGAYDVVIITDFGHGTMTKALIKQITKEARFLAVNAQTNSQNFGFNVISKYPRANFVVLDELEARLATHDKDSPIEDGMLRLGYPQVIVTRGPAGAIGYDGEFYSEKAQADRIVDTLGAGDAALAVSAPFAAAGFAMPDLVHLSNAAGAVKVGILGHQQRVTRAALEAQLAR